MKNCIIDFRLKRNSSYTDTAAHTKPKLCVTSCLVSTLWHICQIYLYCTSIIRYRYDFIVFSFEVSYPSLRSCSVPNDNILMMNNWILFFIKAIRKDKILYHFNYHVYCNFLNYSVKHLRVEVDNKTVTHICYRGIIQSRHLY